MLSLVYLDRRIEWVFSFGRKGKKKTSVEGGRRNRLSVGRLSRFIGQTVNEVSNKTMNPNSTMLLSRCKFLMYFVSSVSEKLNITFIREIEEQVHSETEKIFNQLLKFKLWERFLKVSNYSSNPPCKGWKMFPSPHDNSRSSLWWNT